MILISCSYAITTPESAENGDFSDTGMLFEDSAHSFRELVEKIKDDGFINPSRYPANGSTSEWLSTDSSTDMYTGEEETQSIHYSRNNLPRSAKYWRKAFIAAGIIK